MVNYIYKGYGVTDSNGVAHLDHDASGNPINHSYTGVGAGEIDVVASLDNPVSSGSIVSETYNIWDTLVYDSGVTGRDTTKWSTSGSPSIYTDGTGTTLSATSSSMYSSNTVLTGDFEAIIYVSDIVRGVRVGLNSSNGSTRSTIYNNGYVKIQRISNVPKIYFSSNGTDWTETTYDLNTLTSADCNFFFFLYTSSGNEVAIKFKDLKIYSI